MSNCCSIHCSAVFQGGWLHFHKTHWQILGHSYHTRKRQQQKSWVNWPFLPLSPGKRPRSPRRNVAVHRAQRGLQRRSLWMVSHHWCRWSKQKYTVFLFEKLHLALGRYVCKVSLAFFPKLQTFSVEFENYPGELYEISQWIDILQPDYPHYRWLSCASCPFGYWRPFWPSFRICIRPWHPQWPQKLLHRCSDQ